MTRPSAFYPLRDAYARPVPVPPPRIVIGGETVAGARLAGRVSGDSTVAYGLAFARAVERLMACASLAEVRGGDSRVAGLQEATRRLVRPVAGARRPHGAGNTEVIEEGKRMGRFKHRLLLGYRRSPPEAGEPLCPGVGAPCLCPPFRGDRWR